MARAVALTMAWGLLPPTEVTSISAGSMPSASATRCPGFTYSQLNGLTTRNDWVRPANVRPAGAVPPTGAPSQSSMAARTASTISPIGSGRSANGPPPSVPGRLVTWPAPTRTGVAGSRGIRRLQGTGGPSAPIPHRYTRGHGAHRGGLGSRGVRAQDRPGRARGRRRPPGDRPGDGLAGRPRRLPRVRTGRGPGGGRGARRPGDLRLRDRHRHRDCRQQGRRGPSRPGLRRDHRRAGPAAQRRQHHLPRGQDHRCPRGHRRGGHLSLHRVRGGTPPAPAGRDLGVRIDGKDGHSRTRRSHGHQDSHQDRQREAVVETMSNPFASSPFDPWLAGDPEVSRLLGEEAERQSTTVQLIASENFTSPAVLAASGSILTNKYSEGYPGRRYYGGNQIIDEVEELARDRLKALFGAEHANVQPHAGANANLAAYQALLEPGATILAMRLDHGGHLSHGSPASIVSKWWRFVSYGVTPESNDPSAPGE